MTLTGMCFQAVREHFSALSTEAVLGLPAPLIRDLLPHLTVCQLDELQPALNRRGISTVCGWAGVLQDMCGSNHAVELTTEEEAKHEVMRTLFPLVFYGFTNPYVRRNITNVNTPRFLWAAAKCIRHFLLIASLHQALQGLTAEHRPLLSLLEKHIGSVGVSQSTDLSKRTTQTALYVLHRLLDHGTATRLVVHVQCPVVLAWLLHGRGSQYVNPELKELMHGGKAGPATGASDDQEHQVTPRKRPKLICSSVEEDEDEAGKANFTVDPQVLCGTLSPGDGPSVGACPRGQIRCLEIRQCGTESLRVLNAALPTFFCLRSLTLHSISIFRESDVLSLAGALKQLSDSSCSSITDLSVGVLPSNKLVEVLLDANPNMTSLQVEIQTVTSSPPRPRSAASHVSELALNTLTVKLTELQADLQVMTSVLRRSPRLASLHVAGMRLLTGSSQSQLLSTLSESNGCLRTLTLEDMRLSDCHPDILSLLRGCELEELAFNDCRLLEKSSDKEESLRRLVAAVKAVPSLHTLSLAQNRLAGTVCVLAELFSGSSHSSVRRLNISSNFIQPADLLEFAQRLRTHPPAHRLILDLRRNPADRDPDTWTAALKELRPACVVLVEGWKSTDTMVDHMSNM